MTYRILPSTETPPLPGPRLTVNLGPTGAGKTHWTRRDWFRWPFALAIDTQAPDGVGEYPGRLTTTPNELLATFVKIAERQPDRWRVTYRGPVVLAPATDDVPEFTAFDLAAEILREALLVVEEADKFMDAKTTPPGVYSIAHHGRRLGQGMILNARRAANVPRDVTALADVVRVWLPDEPIDRDYVKARGFPLDVLEALPARGFVLRERTPAGPRMFACWPGRAPESLPPTYQARARAAAAADAPGAPADA